MALQDYDYLEEELADLDKGKPKMARDRQKVRPDGSVPKVGDPDYDYQSGGEIELSNPNPTGKELIAARDKLAAEKPAASGDIRQTQGFREALLENVLREQMKKRREAAEQGLAGVGTDERFLADRVDVKDFFSNKARDRQASLADQLALAARGEGPSAAQDELRQATERNVRAAMAQAQSSRGNPALASMIASRQATMANQQAAGQAGALRAREIQDAQRTLAQLSGQMRGQDQSSEQFQANLDQAINLANLQANLQGRSLYEGMAQENLGKRLDYELQNQALKQGIANRQMDREERDAARRMAQEDRYWQAGTAILGNFFGSLAQGEPGGGYSDEYDDEDFY